MALSSINMTWAFLSASGLGRGFLWGCLLVVLLAGSGCGKGGSDGNSSEERKLSIIQNLLSNCSAQNNGRWPDEKTFRAYLQKQSAETKKAYHFQTPDELLTSPRDHQPFVINYNVKPTGHENQVVAYEKTGSGGKRYVLFLSGMIEEVDAERAAHLKLQ